MDLDEMLYGSKIRPVTPDDIVELFKRVERLERKLEQAETEIKRLQQAKRIDK